MSQAFIVPLLIANLAAAGAVLLVLALRRPVRNLAGAKAAYALWLIAPAAMLATLAPARTVTIHAPAVPGLAIEASLGDASFAEIQAIRSDIALTGPTLPDLATLTLGIWLAGVAAFLLLLIVGQRRAVRRFGGLTPDAFDPRLARAKNTGVGPALVGLFRPRVIVPADFETRFDPCERAMILAHEHIHLSSGHALINASVALMRAVNWFNPLIHLGARFARIDQELACDAAVVGRFPGERRTYAEALLKTQLDAALLPLGCSWPGRTPHLIEERLSMLAKASPGRLRLAAGSTAVAALITLAGFTAWAAEPPQYRTEPLHLAQAVVGGALGAPGEGKTAAPSANATVKPGGGGALPDAGQTAPNSPELAAAIAAGNVRQALELGATPRQIAQMLPAIDPRWRTFPDAAIFVRDPAGNFAIGFGGPNAQGNQFMISAKSLFGDYLPPGGLASLPELDEVFGRPELPPASAAQLAIGARAVAGGSAQEIATAMMAIRPPTAPPLDLSTAQYIRTDGGDLGIFALAADGEGASISVVRGATSFPGLANLPTEAQLMARVTPPR